MVMFMLPLILQADNPRYFILNTLFNLPGKLNVLLNVYECLLNIIINNRQCPLLFARLKANQVLQLYLLF